MAAAEAAELERGSEALEPLERAHEDEDENEVAAARRRAAAAATVGRVAGAEEPLGGPSRAERSAARMARARANTLDLIRARKQESSQQLQISPEAREKFDAIWAKVEARVGIENCHLPKEIVWLNGAPGAGKGANTPFILKTRGFQAKAIQLSELLEGSPEVQEIIASGGLVNDTIALELLLDAIMTIGRAAPKLNDGDHSGEVAGQVEEEAACAVAGAVVDGFPRTTQQVDFVKLLHDRLLELHYKYLNTPLENHFPRPIFRIAVLYVEEEESVRRQLARGRAAIVHNQRVNDSGVGELREVRPTDLDEKAARRRYQIFRDHYDTLLRLKAFFPFHLIDGMGSLNECREQIEKELQYQSALELDTTTFQAISGIPLASDIAKAARRNMVARLDSYEKHDHDIFAKVIEVICEDIVPIIRRCALAGVAVYNTERPIFFVRPMAAEMLADILSERGYAVTWQTRTREVPMSVDRETFEILCTRKTTFQFRIKFERPLIRNTEALQRTLLRPDLEPHSDASAVYGALGALVPPPKGTLMPPVAKPQATP